jgi:sialate O-acetylesterase
MRLGSFGIYGQLWQGLVWIAPLSPISLKLFPDGLFQANCYLSPRTTFSTSTTLSMKKLLLALAILTISMSFLAAAVRLPRLFSDNMVLQRDHAIPIWGWADPKEKITILFNQQIVTVIANLSGKWSTNLAAEAAGGPYPLIIKSKSNTVLFKNVLIGDVWVCSGQSNMEWPLSRALNGVQEIKAANFPLIRHFTVPQTIASEPREDLTAGNWEVCTSENAGRFTAVGYFFAQALQGELKIPIGLIHTSWGGTHSETWTSRQAFEQSPEFQSMIANMPRMNLDSLNRVANMGVKTRIETLQGPMDKIASELPSWKNKDFNDSQWATMEVPKPWEQQALGYMDGEVWFRKNIVLTSTNQGKEAQLELGTIDDIDETYVNGTLIGQDTRYNTKRKYTIPAGLLTAGNNVIAVKVTDTGGDGGFYGDANNLKFTIGDQVQALAGIWKYRVAGISTKVPGVGPNSYPTLLFNSMINPLIPFAIKGVIWYQGESNADRAYQYRQAFPLMISDWRKQWKQGDFPFYFVQLSSYNSNNGNSQRGSSWAELREAQTLTLSLPNTGMAVTTDIGDPKDIHPLNKQDVGKRLAALALNKTYGLNLLSSGPTYQSMKIDGNKIILSFTNLGSGLVASKDAYGYLKGFEIAGVDQKFRFAKALIDGDKIVVFQDNLPSPVAVRYGWADDASEGNLFNKDGFPASPFRTDNWKGITTETKFKLQK